ncbi:DUF4145 domain-containing protein [Ferrimonas lipolytica]|uniref:DUF4145 domain-containing protein n=1 Tax=Ferrimonas lipolytica TaxID=2724191 RepID=A0A6H1UIU6_9GAMM|nr:DUF4145 domain-containing protein [Ferrimonas lipolytica]QIZ78748.1 DUF4145 domain-containing protein [Ferrimonas lipolytica]
MRPESGKEKFKCPHCQTLATQRWFGVGNASKIAKDILHHFYLDYRTGLADYFQENIKSFLKDVDRDFQRSFTSFVPSGFSLSTCSSCQNYCLWVDKELKYPKLTSLPAPNSDLDDEIKELYVEATNILMDSPKGATALLRLALQKLLKQVGKSGKNINSDIKELVAEGLSPKIQQALDLLRVIGNNAVHPGQINLDDNSDIAHKLFSILNFIAEELITKPKELDELYSGLIPEETQEHIKQRDKSTAT